MLADDALVGLSLSGALDAGGPGPSRAWRPLIEAGFIDLGSSVRGRNLYHDNSLSPWAWTCTRPAPGLDDRVLPRGTRSFASTTSSSTTKNLLGNRPLLPHPVPPGEGPFRQPWVRARVPPPGPAVPGTPVEEETGPARPSPCLRRRRTGPEVPHPSVPSPGDSFHRHETWPALMLEGSKLRIDPLKDVNQSRCHRLRRQAERAARGGVLILGGGSPKKLHPADGAADPGSAWGLEESGHRTTSCRSPDARAGHRRACRGGDAVRKAMTWGKVDIKPAARHGDPCYVDSTVGAAAVDGLFAGRRRGPRDAAAVDGPSGGG